MFKFRLSRPQRYAVFGQLTLSNGMKVWDQLDKCVTAEAAITACNRLAEQDRPCKIVPWESPERDRLNQECADA
jgi:hypothetical protein